MKKYSFLSMYLTFNKFVIPDLNKRTLKISFLRRYGIGVYVLAKYHVGNHN